MIIEKFKSKDISIIEQKGQKGTADAIKYCLPKIKNFDGNILILSGDVPLIKFETLKEFINISTTCILFLNIIIPFFLVFCCQHLIHKIQLHKALAC